MGTPRGLSIGLDVTLFQIKSGQDAVISQFSSDATPELISRFRALGLVMGAIVTVERHLPFGGPVVVRFGGGAFALEPEAASLIHVNAKGQP